MTILLIIISTISFALFYYYDYCVIRKPESIITRLGFNIALSMTMLVTVIQGIVLRAVFFRSMHSLLGVVCGIGMVLSFLFLIWALFFSLPAGTYSNPTEKRRVYDRKLYALCRHPGYLGFFFFYLCFGVLLGKSSWLCFGSLCILNFVYIILQDRWTFPLTFSDYPEYRKRVPFLIPTPGSIARCIYTIRT